MKVVIYEENERFFYPLINLYPQFNLRTGMRTIAENTVHYFPSAKLDYIGRALFSFKRVKPEVPTVYLSGRVMLTDRIAVPKDEVKFLVGRNVVGFAKHKPPFPRDIKDIVKATKTIKKTKRISGFVLDNMWDLVKYNEALLRHHLSMREGRGKAPEGMSITGSKRDVYVASDVVLYDHVALDVTEGPVYIDRGAVIKPFTTIIGPSYIGPETIVDRAKITKSSIGPQCRIGGEVEACIFQGYGNKYHEGFIGHSFIGEWVNLGAMTTNSDLKNNYGPVRIAMDKKMLNSGMLKLGCFIGDHTKTGIGTLIPTGAVIGSFVNFFGGGIMPQYVRSFRWLTSRRQEGYKLEKAIATAKVVMKRRKKRMSKKYENVIRKSYRWRNLS